MNMLVKLRPNAMAPIAENETDGTLSTKGMWTST